MSSSIKKFVPVMPLKDIVIFPQTVVNIMVGRVSSIESFEVASNSDKLLLLVSQKDAHSDLGEVKVSPQNLYPCATLGRIVNRINLSNGTIKILVEGLQRVKLTEFDDNKSYLLARYSPLVETIPKTKEQKFHLQKTSKRMIDLAKQYFKINQKSQETTFKVITSDKPIYSADIIATHLPVSIEKKIQYLKETNILKRCNAISQSLKTLIEASYLDRKINQEVKQNIDKTHREFFLNEKIKAIRKQLGDENDLDEVDLLKKRIKQAILPEHAEVKALSELKKLSLTSPQSPEYSIVRNYLDTLLSLPWYEQSTINEDIIAAENILNKEHYGLEEVKELILEHLAIQQRTKKIGGSIICLVGPPGVGKTSLAESIAHATGRNYVRIALGGIKDEAEIRGHRRTYIGSMPGKILQKITQSKVKNPLFLLDEIDKMSMDFRGDPASALLEVLDSEQNHSFSDHYLEIEYDLSQVLFIATSNSYRISEALLDRMEIIELSGYTDTEKQHIAKDYLLPKQKKRNGIQPNEIRLTPKTIPLIIQKYTREAGVRSLERQLAKLCRKTVRIALAKTTSLPLNLTAEKVTEMLGVPPYQHSEKNKKNRIGTVVGLAWNSIGGDILSIETTSYPGKGKLTYTGKLGEVMQESMQTAYSVVRSYHLQFGIDPLSFTEKDLHVHVPEGATPKDGPSAGLAIVFAIASNLNQTKILSQVAMTGEITLGGDILPIGGLKQKLLAAKRNGLKTILIPQNNRQQLVEIPKDITEGLTIIPVEQLEEAIPLVFAKPIASIHIPSASLNKKNSLVSSTLA